METMTDEGSCIRIKSLGSALKGCQQEDIKMMQDTIAEIQPVIETYYDQCYELWKAVQEHDDLKLDLEPNEDLKLGSIAFIPLEASHDQINEEVYR
jgi:hypothetical protein